MTIFLYATLALLIVRIATGFHALGKTAEWPRTKESTPELVVFFVVTRIAAAIWIATLLNLL